MLLLANSNGKKYLIIGSDEIDERRTTYLLNLILIQNEEWRFDPDRP
jgi:hypothetical protein